jgi:hypothetical protein
MATVGTTTNGNPLLYAAGTNIGRWLDGTLYASFLDNSGNVAIYKSTNGGASWALWATWAHSGIQEHAMRVSDSGDVHVVIRTNESSQDRIYYRRISTASGVWKNETALGAVANGGVAGAVYGGVDVVHWYRQSSQEHYTAVGAAVTVGAQHGVELFGLYDNPFNGAQPTWNNQIVGVPSASTRRWLWTGSGRIGLSMDVEHSGSDGNAGTPTFWIAAGRTSLRMIRVGWYGGWWQGPDSPTTILSSITAQNSITGRWDGSRFLAVVPGTAADTVMLVERDKANSTTQLRVSGAHPTGNIRSCTLAYDPSNGDVRVFAVGTSTAVLYYASYVRATGVWSGWSTVLATAVLGSTPENYSVRRSASGASKYDVVTAHSGAPNTITHTRQTLTYPPTVPYWETPSTGVAQDVNAALVLNWGYSGIDPDDAQTAYALRRQIGAGAFAYFRASDQTWQATEQKNTSGTTDRTLASGWGAGTDANHSYSVKVWNSADVASSYSSALVVVPSVKVQPTITNPTAAMVLNGSRITVTWTVAEQTGYRVHLADGVTFQAVHDSEFQTDAAARSYEVPYDMPDGGSWQIWLVTANNEGLVSTVVTQLFTTDYTEPPVPATAAVAMSLSGVIRVTTTHLAPAGAQPAVQGIDLYRRPVGAWSTALNPNPYFEVDASGWQASAAGAGAATIARSTTQKHEGVASLRVTPTAPLGPAAFAELSAAIAVTPGELMTASGWIRPDTANKAVAAFIHWFTSGMVYISTSIKEITPVAGTWIYAEVSANAPATAAFAICAAGVSQNPAVGDACYIDEVMLRRGYTGTPVRIAAGIVGGAVTDDWRAKSGVAYEYRGVAYGVNGTVQYGPWTA